MSPRRSPEPNQSGAGHALRRGAAFAAFSSLSLQACYAWATKQCPPGTHPSIRWRLAPWVVVVITVLLVWLAFRYARGLWRYLIALPVLALGLALAFLLLILPGPCVD